MVDPLRLFGGAMPSSTLGCMVDGVSEAISGITSPSDWMLLELSDNGDTIPSKDGDCFSESSSRHTVVIHSFTDAERACLLKVVHDGDSR